MERANPKKMGMVESAKLINLIESEYSASKKTDDEFAKYAADKLGFDVVKIHVTNRRVALEIPSYQAMYIKPGKGDVDALHTLIVDLERRITKLEYNEVEMQRKIDGLTFKSK
jgi:hypothetical protein